MESYMKIQDIMTRSVKTCRPETNLAAVGTLMWEGDCGIIPVVNPAGKLEGILTDRDICIATATKGRKAEEITAGELMSRHIHSCLPENDPQVALAAMREHKVRRLPVLDSDEKLVGMLSINDLILEAKKTRKKKSEGPSYADVMETLKALCQHREAMIKAA